MSSDKENKNQETDENQKTDENEETDENQETSENEDTSENQETDENQETNENQGLSNEPASLQRQKEFKKLVDQELAYEKYEDGEINTEELKEKVGTDGYKEIQERYNNNTNTNTNKIYGYDESTVYYSIGSSLICCSSITLLIIIMILNI